MVDLPELPFIDTMMATIVFYGFDRELSVKEAKVLIDSVCALLGEKPSHAHVGMGEGKRERTPRYSTVDRGIAKGDFDDYAYFKAVGYFEKGNVRDCSLAVGVGGERNHRTFEIHFRHNQRRREIVDAILREVLRHLSPQYGILYYLSVREGPRWFITGVRSSGMPDALGEASAQFRHEYFFGKKFSDGYFRDVFQWNYLSDAHLRRQIEGVSFRDWVLEPSKQKGWLAKEQTRDTLSFLDNGCAVWELTKSEVADVRGRLLKAGLLMVKI